MSWQRETPTLRLVECDIDAPLLAFAKAQYAFRRRREAIFGLDIFAEPAWDMLLDLTAAHGEGARVSVTSLCIAASVPATTALRWLTQMVESGIFQRVPDPADRRRAFIALSDKAIAAMSAYFASLRAPVLQAA